MAAIVWQSRAEWPQLYGSIELSYYNFVVVYTWMIIAVQYLQLDDHNCGSTLYLDDHNCVVVLS
jgi:hypothetical protein